MELRPMFLIAFTLLYLGHMLLAHAWYQRQNLHRVAPDSNQDLEEFVTELFSGLSCTTIFCISVLGDPYASLLQKLLCFPSHVHARILVSCLNSKNQPISMLLPVDSVLEGDSDDVGYSGIKDWNCPWGSTVVDDVAPEFRLILEGAHSSSVKHPVQDTDEKKLHWWVERKNFDRHALGFHELNWELGIFMVWYLETCGGARVTQLCLKKGSFVSKVGCLEEEKCMASRNESNGGENLSELANKLVLEAVNGLEGLHSSVNIEPTILVLDYEVQILSQLSSILFIVKSSFQQADRLNDQLDAFYLLNPSGDLNYTQNEFETWFRDQNLETDYMSHTIMFHLNNITWEAGCAPPAEELAVALKSNDLFMYIGHGCGYTIICFELLFCVRAVVQGNNIFLDLRFRDWNTVPQLS
ncbi:separase-like [Rosa rugosa]|uniref:separase-like n=1 Tax=Rosa rugosa TaxID=74645 RepID=UPI002B411D51|nr:separase-like [Rosa rugosa]